MASDAIGTEGSTAPASTPDAREALIDVDVHCSPHTSGQLAEYLPEYWTSYFESARFDIDPSAGGIYARHPKVDDTPPGSTGFPQTPAELRERYPGFETVDRMILSCLVPFGTSRNPHYQVALCRAVNDWLISEWAPADERFRVSLNVPFLHVGEAVAEIEKRASDPRVAQVILPIRGTQVRWGHPNFRPIFRAAAEAVLPVALHAWGAANTAVNGVGVAHSYFEDYLTNSLLSVQAHVVSMIAEGVFDDVPDLRVALLECGFTWIPPYMWRLDKNWKGLWREVPWVRDLPSEYFSRHFRVSSQPTQLPADPAQRARMHELVGSPDLLMYSSDFPNLHGEPPKDLLADFGGLERERVARGNAAVFYGDRA